MYMCTCICICVYVYMCICVYVYMYMYMYMYMYRISINMFMSSYISQKSLGSLAAFTLQEEKPKEQPMAFDKEAESDVNSMKHTGITTRHHFTTRTIWGLGHTNGCRNEVTSPVCFRHFHTLTLSDMLFHSKPCKLPFTIPVLTKS